MMARRIDGLPSNLWQLYFWTLAGNAPTARSNRKCVAGRPDAWDRPLLRLLFLRILLVAGMIQHYHVLGPTCLGNANQADHQTWPCWQQLHNNETLRPSLVGGPRYTSGLADLAVSGATRIVSELVRASLAYLLVRSGSGPAKRVGRGRDGRQERLHPRSNVTSVESPPPPHDPRRCGDSDADRRKARSTPPLFRRAHTRRRSPPPLRFERPAGGPGFGARPGTGPRAPPCSAVCTGLVGSPALPRARGRAHSWGQRPIRARRTPTPGRRLCTLARAWCAKCRPPVTSRRGCSRRCTRCTGNRPPPCGTFSR